MVAASYPNKCEHQLDGVQCIHMTTTLTKAFDLLSILVKTCCQTRKSVKIQLPLKGTDLGQFEVMRHDFFECVGFVDRKLPKGKG